MINWSMKNHNNNQSINQIESSILYWPNQQSWRRLFGPKRVYLVTHPAPDFAALFGSPSYLESSSLLSPHSLLPFHFLFPVVPLLERSRLLRKTQWRSCCLWTWVWGNEDENSVLSDGGKADSSHPVKTDRLSACCFARPKNCLRNWADKLLLWRHRICPLQNQEVRPLFHDSFVTSYLLLFKQPVTSWKPSVS